MSSNYGTIPASNSSSTPPAPPPEGSSSTASALAALRPWRELADPAGRADARRRARANYKLAFLAVVSLSMLWRWWPAACLSTGLACFVNLSRNKTFLFLMMLTLFELAVTGAAASVLVTVPVGGHAVLHRPAAESADEEAAGSVVWNRGIAPPPRDTPAAANEQA